MYEDRGGEVFGTGKRSLVEAVPLSAQNNHVCAVGRRLAPDEAYQSNQISDVG